MRNRREFFVTAGASVGSLRLIGTALASGSGLPSSVASLKGTWQSVSIPTHEFRGDIEERIDVPASWDLNVMRMAGHNAPALSPEQILKELRNPLGTPPLRELAAGRKSAVITFDDLTRPTPISDVVPLVVHELEAAGLGEENIFFLGSFGAHRTMEGDEVAAKLGTDLSRRYIWFNHNVFDDLEDVGQTSFKNRIFINQMFLRADLRITISGVKIHTIAGYGGGAKAVLPGVAGVQSIAQNHKVIGSENSSVAPARIFRNDVRDDMIEAARLARVDFSVQIVYNNMRQPCGVFAGDVVDAHVAACRQANSQHRTPSFANADVVIANAYPQNCQATKALAWFSRSLRDDGTAVLIIQHPWVMSGWHYLYHPSVKDDDVLSLLRPLSGKKLRYRLIVYSQYLHKRQMLSFPPETTFTWKWEDVVGILREQHKGDSRVAVYPYATLQHEERDLDEGDSLS